MSIKWRTISWHKDDIAVPCLLNGELYHTVTGNFLLTKRLHLRKEANNIRYKKLTLTKINYQRRKESYRLPYIMTG